MDIKEILSRLSMADGVSGDEKNAAEVALELLSQYTDDCCIKNGNVCGYFGDNSKYENRIMIDAHIDQIGLIVTDITENGFVRFSNVGGVDRRLLPAQQVVIHGREKVTGTVCSVPPHLSGGEKGKAAKIEELLIDTGMNRENALSVISRGDKVTFKTTFRELLNNEVTGSALDDRCGVAAILYALELLKDTQLDGGLTVVFSAQEELGERGAKIAAYDVNPAIALAVDVSFAYTSGECEYKCGKLGKGPMIGISPSLSKNLSDEIIRICRTNDIPYQTEVMNGLTSTNADQFSVNRSGCMAGTISIPLKYMHTPSEVIKIEDVENTGRLLAAMLKDGGNC